MYLFPKANRIIVCCGCCCRFHNSWLLQTHLDLDFHQVQLRKMDCDWRCTHSPILVQWLVAVLGWYNSCSTTFFGISRNDFLPIITWISFGNFTIRNIKNGIISIGIANVISWKCIPLQIRIELGKWACFIHAPPLFERIDIWLCWVSLQQIRRSYFWVLAHRYFRKKP